MPSDRRRHNNDTGLLELQSLQSLEDKFQTSEEGSPSEDSSILLQAARENDLSEESPVLEVTMHFSRGLAEGHSSLIGDIADPSLQEGLRMREYTIKAGERKAGSARFSTSDRAHRAQRQRWVDQSRQAREPAAHAEAEADKPRRSDNVIHLGSLEEEAGGGLAEESQDIFNTTENPDNPDQRNSGETDQWEDTGAADLEDHEEKPDTSWLARQKANMQNDRMSERGIYQAKIARTGKW